MPCKCATSCATAPEIPSLASVVPSPVRFGNGDVRYARVVLDEPPPVLGLNDPGPAAVSERPQPPPRRRVKIEQYADRRPRRTPVRHCNDEALSRIERFQHTRAA